MHKEEFIKYPAKKHHRPQQYYRDVINEVSAGIQEQLAKGKSIHFISFGSFYIRLKMGGKAHNFKTNKPMEYKTVRQVAFRVGNILKQAMRRRKGLFSR